MRINSFLLLDAEKLIGEESQRYEVKNLLEFPLDPQPKERSTREGRTRLKTRNYEKIVAELFDELNTVARPDDERRLGLRIVFVVHQEHRGDVTNFVKSVEDGLNRKAYHDDKRIRYVTGLEVVRPDEPERILVEISERD